MKVAWSGVLFCCLGGRALHMGTPPSYQPSEFEDQQNPLQPRRACAAHSDDVRAWLSGVGQRTPDNPLVFSRLQAPGLGREVLLEPLVWNLADPRMVCEGIEGSSWAVEYQQRTQEEYFLSKEFLALPPNRS